MSLIKRDPKAAGCEKIFAEQVSSVAAPALEFVREGDVLVVTKPDRLARSTRNLLDIVEDLEKRGTRLFNATSARAESCAVADHG
jgi:DNA invertase Pin-like site-specific DNA recombinase